MTRRPVDHIKFEDLGFFLVFWKQQNSNSGSNKTSIFIDKVPFTLHTWIGLTDTNTDAKEEEKYLPGKASKKGHQS